MKIRSVERRRGKEERRKRDSVLRAGEREREEGEKEKKGDRPGEGSARLGVEEWVEEGEEGEE